MKTKLSNSAVNKYNECSLCYKLHYIDGIRPVKTSSALVFGSALDSGLNELLITKNVEKAHNKFQEQWYGYMNDENITYFKSDVDDELLIHYGKDALYDHNAWNCLRIKGEMFIEAYHKEVLPKIKKVIVVQEPIAIKNDSGDEIIGFLDLIVEWEDGKVYLMDNKSSKGKYENNSAKEGQQLPLYHYAVKDQYKLAGIGYIVLIKTINKNKIRVCNQCGYVNPGSHRKCNGLVQGSRCNGEITVIINPTVDIQYVFNTCYESDENRVLELFDTVNNAISNNQFAEEHVQARGKYGYCPYRDYFDGNPDFYIKIKK